MNGLPSAVRRVPGGFVLTIRYPSGTIEEIRGATVAAVKEEYIARREEYLEAMYEMEMERLPRAIPPPIAYEDRYWEEGRAGA